jgi:Xaa-Pro aminopeptidase
LDSAVFPEGTNGSKLDPFARQFLWKEGMDYRHGTGHGVGHFLCVHEGPQSISTRVNSVVPLQVGMVVSNEPGYYENGNFGIRLENLVIVVDKSVKDGKYGKFFGFEHVTCVPMQTSLLNLEYMTKDEINWVNEYNSWCLEKLSPLLHDDEKTLTWLKHSTKPIGK